MTNCKLSIDAGGTFFKSAVFSKDNKMLSEIKQTPVNFDADKNRIIDTYRKIYSDYSVKYEIDSVSVSTPGPFDYKSGTSYMKHKFAAIYGMPLKGLLFPKTCGLSFCSDSNAFLSGEIAIDEELRSKNVIAFTIGTGLGFSAAKQGEVIRNEDGGPIDVVWNLPYRGKTAEDFLSGRGVVRIYEEAGGVKGLSAKDIACRADHDEIAKATFFELGSAIYGMAEQFIEKYKADFVVLGGQVSKSFNLFKDGILSNKKGFACKFIKGKDIDNSALLGALKETGL